MGILKTNCAFKNQISFCAKNYLNATDVSAEEIKALLATAEKIKTNRNLLIAHKYSEKTLMLLTSRPCPWLQISLHKATKIAKINLETTSCPQLETLEHIEDMGKLLSLEVDIIFCQFEKHFKAKKFAEYSSIPIINAGSCRCNLLHILSDLFTIQQHFRTLNGLNISWVGKPCPILNTYLHIAPRLGMELKYSCRYGQPVSPAGLNEVISENPENAKHIKECANIKDAIQGAHVILTSMHSESCLRIKLDDLESNADKNWIFLPALPRSSIEVEDEVFHSEQNLAWKAYENLKWICTALIVQFL